MHGAHWRSALAEPPRTMPDPTPHFAQALHFCRPAEAVKVPSRHAAHVRSLLAVAAAVMYEPAAQGWLTASQDAVPTDFEKDTPAWHAVHERSVLSVPAAQPNPAGHVPHATHAWLPDVALKELAPHTRQVRSVDAVGALSMYAPAGHGAPTAAHALPSLDLENVVTPSHAPHSRSAVAEPAAVWPSPAGHVRHAAHAWLPEVALNSPAAHAAHSRSDDAPGATVWYSPFWHAVMAEHTRSACECGGVDVYCPLGHLAACVAHVRSVVSVGALVSHSPPVHCRTATHASPLLVLENVASCVHAAHWRSAVAEPAADVPDPMAHVRQALHAELPALTLNWPLAHSSQTRSADAVAAVLSASPATHGAETAPHVAPLLLAE